MKKFVLSMLIMLSVHFAIGQTYFTEDFESAFTGAPPAPAGWTQTRIRTIYNPTFERDWIQNTWTGSAWSLTSAGTNPAGAYSGNGVAWLDDATYMNSTIPQAASRLESPVINLSASTSPYVRFWYFNNQGFGQTLNLRTMVSADGGATWDVLTPIVNGFTVTNLTWNRISVAIPAAYRTANFKFAFELTNLRGANNPFIDLATVEEFSPSTITSSTTGDWNATGTWVGGIIPTADNNVVIASGTTVTVGNASAVFDGIIARCQNLTVDGTLDHGFSTAAGSGNIVHAFGNIFVNGTLKAYYSTYGRTVFCGGSLNINLGGVADFSVSNINYIPNGTTTPLAASLLVFLGNQAASFNNSGTLTGGMIRNVIHLNPGGFTYNAPVTVTNTFGLHLGAVNPNGNLTLGNKPISGTQTIECANGTLTSNPAWNNTNVTNRGNYYYSPNWVPLTQTTLIPGNEIELVSSVRTITGAFQLNTHNNLQLAYPLTVGTASTGSISLVRGILLTDPTNIILAREAAGSISGVAPSTATPPINHGSYIVGPFRSTFPASGSSTRNFPLGVGTAYNGANPSSNVLKSLTITTGTAGGQSPTVTIEPAPGGSVNTPLTALMGTRSYRINLNGGTDFPATTTFSMTGMNYTLGNSDNLTGVQDDLRIAQSTSLSGAWTERSAASGSGTFTDNVVYTRTTTASIAPLAVNGEYFCLSSAAVPQTYASATVTQNISFVGYGSTNQDVIGIQVVMNGNVPPLNITQFDLNANGTTSLADISNAKIYYTGLTNTFSATNQFGSTLASIPAGTFSITGSQVLIKGTNYFWLTFDVAPVAPILNLIDGECTSITVGGTPYVPTITAPAGSRTILGPLAGTYTIGASGYFTTLTSAVSALNAFGVSDATTFSLIDIAYPSETFPIVINTIAGASASKTLTIKPASGVVPLISGSVANNAVISLSNASFVTIDGSNVIGGSSRDLTIQNTSTSSPGVVLMGSSSTTPFVNNVIKNCIILSGTNTSTSSYGIKLNNYFNNILVTSNDIRKAYLGINVNASNAALNGNNVKIASNIMTATGVNALGNGGIDVFAGDGVEVFNNEIANIIVTTALTPYGIWIRNNSKNVKVFSNNIHTLGNTSANYGPNGIKVNTGLSNANIHIYNNLIYDITGPGYSYLTVAANNPIGIMISATQGGINIYNNSIYLYGNTLSSANAISACILIGDNALTNVRNNILVNNLGLSGTTGYGSYAIYGGVYTNPPYFTDIDYNDYYVNPTGTGGKRIGKLNGTNYATLALWKGATGQDNHSINSDPLFTSNTNLVPQTGSPVIAAGLPIATVTNDYTGATRSLVAPTMGAYEVVAGLLTWTGATDNDWNKSTNWSPDGVPFTNTSVTIPNVTNDPVVYQPVSNPARCFDLAIQTGGALLTINPAGALSVNGTLSNASGNTGLVIKSGGSLIENTTGVAATVESDIVGGEWHLISSPVSDAVAGMFLNKYLQKHTESTNLYTDIYLSTESLVPMQGFALYDAANFTSQFTGTLNAGNQSIAFTRTAAGSTSGWNLAGNPYPSSIDWDALSGWTKTNVNNATYIHVNSATWASYVGGVGTNGGTRYIAPCQGFFVNAGSLGAATLAMTDAVRVHNATPFFKNTVSNLVRLQVSGNGYTDEAVVRFLPESTPEFDGDFDAHKLFGDVDNAAQIYSLGSEPLAINALPETKTVQVGMRVNTSGTFIIAATEVNDLPFVSLEDTKTGIFTDLLKGSYTFSIAPGENEQRFVLHFNSLSVNDLQKSLASIYSYQKTVYIDLKDNVNGNVFIYNISGQLVFTAPVGQGMNKINLENMGNYIVRVITAKSTIVNKVWIQ